jgi:hypothetical protein
MSFMSYGEVRPWAKAIRKAVSDRTMPPWHADAPPGTFLTEMSLSAREIDTIVAWVDSGAPEGDRAELPAPRVFAHEVAHHDYSAANPNRQFDPPRDIFFGEATDAEMALMSVAYTLDDQDLAIEPELPAR